LNKEREIPDPSPEQCLETGFKLKDTGNDLLKAGSYHEALKKYRESFAAIHITISGRARTIHADGFYISELTSGAHKNMRGDYVRMILRGTYDFLHVIFPTRSQAMIAKSQTPSSPRLWLLERTADPGYLLQSSS